MDRPLRLPDGVVHVRTTAVFSDEQHPAGIRRAHRVADGVWARLVVHTGSLGFVFDDTPHEPVTVSAGGEVIIPPQRVHHVVFAGPATFVLEFFRTPAAGAPAPAPGTESTGLAE
jgi:tellurite resistance-related uncharacterized protein